MISHNHRTLSELKSKFSDLDSIAERDGLSLNLRVEKENLLDQIRLIESDFIADIQQKAKVRWLKDGDENSKFFHGVVNGRARKNSYMVCSLTVFGKLIRVL